MLKNACPGKKVLWVCGYENANHQFCSPKMNDPNRKPQTANRKSINRKLQTLFTTPFRQLKNSYLCPLKKKQ